jgi:hypothetical protein
MRVAVTIRPFVCIWLENHVGLATNDGYPRRAAKGFLVAQEIIAFADSSEEELVKAFLFLRLMPIDIHFSFY